MLRRVLTVIITVDDKSHDDDDDAGDGDGDDGVENDDEDVGTLFFVLLVFVLIVLLLELGHLLQNTHRHLNRVVDLVKVVANDSRDHVNNSNNSAQRVAAQLGDRLHAFVAAEDGPVVDNLQREKARGLACV